MNYKVLYRKYRPNDFENIVGQDYIVKTLKNSILNNNISHAYIFSGPRGTGKTSTAKVFSKAINCINQKEGSPCENCEFCKNFIENPDIIEIDAASNNGVDEIRNLIDNIKLTPTNGKYKVYIIDEVHMLTTSAFNALLLTLEEPPAHAIFILATTNIENVPITILSRCQRFDFQKITINTLVERLKEICEKEGIEVEDEALKEIAYLSEGGMRDALSLLDQLSKSNQKITLESVENQIKTISQKSIKELLQLLENNNVEKLLELINDFRIRSVDYKTLIKKIIDISSNIAKNIKKTGNYNRLNYMDYKNLIINLSDSLVKININVDPYVIIELILLEYVEINFNNKETISEKIEDTDENIEKIKNTQTKVCDKKIVELRINNCFVNVRKDYLENAKQIFNKLKTTINFDGKIKSIIMDCNVVAASDKNLILTCINEHVADDANNYLENIESYLSKEFDLNVKVIFISEDRWKIEKEKYIDNLKYNKNYQYIEEENKELSTEPIINDVFDLSKVEII